MTSKDSQEWLFPREIDRIFRDNPSPTAAFLVSNPSERFYRMPLWYKCAGDLLAAHAAANTSDRRNLVYPMLACYRLAIELHLKRLVERHGFRTGPKTHDLRVLWERFECILRERRCADALGLVDVRRLVYEMQDADEKSDGFRFPTDTKGSPFINGDWGVDLAEVREAMSRLECFFECWSAELEHQDDVRSDMYLTGDL